MKSPTNIPQLKGQSLVEIKRFSAMLVGLIDEEDVIDVTEFQSEDLQIDDLKPHEHWKI